MSRKKGKSAQGLKKTSETPTSGPATPTYREGDKRKAGPGKEGKKLQKEKRGNKLCWETTTENGNIETGRSQLGLKSRASTNEEDRGERRSQLYLESKNGGGGGGGGLEETKDPFIKTESYIADTTSERGGPTDPEEKGGGEAEEPHRRMGRSSPS